MEEGREGVSERVKDGEKEGEGGREESGRVVEETDGGNEGVGLLGGGLREGRMKGDKGRKRRRKDKGEAVEKDGSGGGRGVEGGRERGRKR